MKKKQWIKYFEEINGRKPTVLELSELYSERNIVRNSRNIKINIGIVVSLAVIIGVTSLALNSKSGNKDAITTISSATEEVNVKDMSEQLKNEKQEEVQKLKEQITSLDSKISESEKLVEKLKEKTFVPKLDIKAIRKNDLSSLKGTWRTSSGNEFIIDDPSEVHVIASLNGQKHESIIELDNSQSNLKNRSAESKFQEVESISARPKNTLGGSFILVAAPAGVIMKPSDDGKLTDKTNHDEDRLFGGHQYEAMLSSPEDVYYRVKPDTSQLEEEEKNLDKLQADREAIKKELESKEKGDE